jgi:hypothetical protein
LAIGAFTSTKLKVDGVGVGTENGAPSEYHWQQDELHHVVLQTMFAIEEGGKG